MVCLRECACVCVYVYIFLQLNRLSSPSLDQCHQQVFQSFLSAAMC